jgi:N-acetyl-anhydromuramyl-L-alanine amidase AmpD
VDRDGDIYSLLPLDVIGRHVIGLNHVSIGIENVGVSDKLTQVQLEADAALVQDLLKREPTLHYLIGHFEYTKKNLPHYSLYKELDTKYRPTYKTDPGRRFMTELRKKLASRGVKLAD